MSSFKERIEKIKSENNGEVKENFDFEVVLDEYASDLMNAILKKKELIKSSTAIELEFLESIYKKNCFDVRVKYVGVLKTLEFSNLFTAPIKYVAALEKRLIQEGFHYVMVESTKGTQIFMRMKLV